MNEAQIMAMEMQRQLMWNAAGGGMVYRRETMVTGLWFLKTPTTMPRRQASELSVEVEGKRPID